MNVDILKRDFIPKYLAAGEQRFYRFLLTYALDKLVGMEKKTYTGISPDLEFLEYYEQFLILYRREGEGMYLDLAALFRKAGHKIYRVRLQKGMTSPNAKFLQLVS